MNRRNQGIKQAGVGQGATPIYDALQSYVGRRVVSFDVPGHKQGKGQTPLKEVFGERTLSMDLNSSKPLDNLTHPTSVIRDGELLAAQAFKSNHAFFMVNGTTSAVQTMIFAACKPGEKIIMPRNVHKSAINAMILCGAVPIYVNPGVEKSLGISLGMAYDDVEKAVKEHPDAKAVFVNNPTYYGVCSDIKAIARLCRENNMMLLADEAHGTHFYFSHDCPMDAMSAGAHMSAVSMHKTGGSLTQSSLLLTGEGVNPEEIRQIINLTQTTSGSYLLLASLDVARRELVERGESIFKEVRRLSDYARSEINKEGRYRAFASDIVDGKAVFDFDSTKLSIHTRSMGLAGVEVYDILRDEYDIQIEFGDIGNVLAIISVGDRQLEIERLLGALTDIGRRYGKSAAHMLDHEYIDPIVDCTPQKAFYAQKLSIPLENCLGKISGEIIMAYPPGIPIVAPGERITREIIEYVKYAKEKGCTMAGTKDPSLEFIEVIK